MSILPGYTLLDEVAESAPTLLFRASRADTGRRVLVKVPKEDYPPATLIARLKAEFDITRELNLPSLLSPLEFAYTRYKPALIFEDFAGCSLRRLLAAGALELPRFFHIALQLTESLGELHERGVIHRGIAPESILVEPELWRIRLTHLGMATRLRRENPGAGGLEGNLAYLSPEQTGRMNRAVDHRADLYSLGAVFYEMLTGSRCFEATDPLELLHCHIARQPVPPTRLRPDCPPVLSRMVLKLLAKTAEERYQGAAGLAADLREASRLLKGSAAIEDFVLGREDVSSAFSLPGKLYGHEQEIQQLLSALERASEGHTELVLISGPAGIGKSSLVNELHRLLVARRGYLVSGKFEQLHREQPYSALVHALRKLLRLRLSGEPASIEALKERLHAAVFPNGRLLVDLIPELELLLGPQPPAIELPTAEARSRFDLLFERLISALTSPEHPLVLFLDDMQWADPASLALLQRMLIAPFTRGLLLLCSYRDNEVSASHPFLLLVGELRQKGRPFTGIQVGPLAAGDIRNLLADALGAKPDAVAELADVLRAKTGGNPFFLHQLLQSLHSDGLLFFERSARGWRWDLERIRQAPYTDNVVSLMAEKLQRLPKAVRELLQLAACVGSSFELSTLARIHESSPRHTARLLYEAMREGLLIPGGGSAHEVLPAALTEEGLESLSDGVTYRFLHDRVQQSAYGLIPERDRPAVHLKIGRLLWSRDLGPEEQGFEVVSQLNLGLRELTDEAEREAVAELNLAAGRHAKASSAYASAAACFRSGCALLGEPGWQRRFELLWQLTVERAECEYLLTHFEEAEAAFGLALAWARSPIQAAQVYKIKIMLYTNLGKYLDACRTGVEALRLFGIHWPEDLAGVDAALAQQDIQGLLRGRKVEELVDLPEEQDPEALAVSMLLAHLISPFNHGFASKAPKRLVCSMLVSQVLRTGRTSDAGAYGFASYASSLVQEGDYADAYAFARLSIEVAERHGYNLLKGRNYTLLGGIINHWTHPARTSSAYLVRAFNLLLESGDLIYGVYACSNLALLAIARGDPLQQVDEELQQYADFVRQSKYQEFISLFEVCRQLLRCLKRQTDTPWSLPALDAGEGTRARVVWLLSQMKLRYMSGRYAEALALGAEAEQRIGAAAGTILVPESRFYYALALAAAEQDESGAPPHARLAQLSETYRGWAESCPANFRQQWLLIEAERARLGGQELEAMRLYDAAIEASGESGYLHIEALANELAARLHLKERPRAAHSYLREARYAYARWGATAKVAELEARYPELLGGRAVGGAALGSHEATGRSPVLVEHGLDLFAVTKSSQVLSGEIQLRQLLEKLIHIVMESAGAQRAVLLLSRQEGLFLEAEATVDSVRATVLQSISLEAVRSLPRSVIHFVAHSQDCLVLDNAMDTAPYCSDPYVVETQARSICCLPVMARKKPVGLLYLEHQATNVFTSERRDVLTLLSAQAAISIENAQLYDTLEQRVEVRTRELKEKNDQLAAALSRLQEVQRLLVEREKLASLGAMTAAIAHEVKNPLNFICNFADLAQSIATELREQLLQPEWRSAPDGLKELELMADELVMNTSKIKGHGLRLDRIINSMRQHSSGNHAVRQAIDLNELIARYVALATQEFAARRQEARIELVTRYDETLGKVNVAPDELGRVIVNLLQNALYAVHERQKRSPGEPPRVRVDSYNLGSQVEVRVWDNGGGIAPEVQGRIFSPFFTTKPPGEGTGLGLSLSHNIVVQFHGGQLRFESEAGHWTEFIMTLPRS